MEDNPGRERLFLGYKAGEWILKILGFFIILEPVWMLLPFAGFLYGFALHIQTLARSPATAWLTQFVFRVRLHRTDPGDLRDQESCAHGSLPGGDRRFPGEGKGCRGDLQGDRGGRFWRVLPLT